MTVQYSNGLSLSDEQYLDYMMGLRLHIHYVREAGKQLGVSEEQLIAHDLSKWEPEEFPQYAREFFPLEGGEEDRNKVKKDFAKAWLHHIHHNPHHWQHWMFSDGYSPEGAGLEKGVMEMPKEFALEMVADWMGASMAYTESWDMEEWLQKNFYNVVLHSATRTYVLEILRSIGYIHIPGSYKWFENLGYRIRRGPRRHGG